MPHPFHTDQGPLMPLRAGLRLPGKEMTPPIEGTWSVWSQSDHSPGAHFLVPSDTAAFAYGIKYLTVRVKNGKNSPLPEVKILGSHPHNDALVGR